jgi:dihydrofolate synthase/folylpolyglutamate synthase
VRAAEFLGLPREPGGKGIAVGVRSVRWPGRLERFESGGRAVFLDGCHNAEGAEALARFLRAAGLAGRFHLVFGALADKDVEAIADLLFPLAAGVTLVTAPSARAIPAAELARRCPGVPGGAAVEESPRTALERLLSRGGGNPIIVAGSLYLVGEARAFLLAAGTPEGIR